MKTLTTNQLSALVSNEVTRLSTVDTASVLSGVHTWEVGTAHVRSFMDFYEATLVRITAEDYTIKNVVRLSSDYMPTVYEFKGVLYPSLDALTHAKEAGRF